MIVCPCLISCNGLSVESTQLHHIILENNDNSYYIVEDALNVSEIYMQYNITICCTFCQSCVCCCSFETQAFLVVKQTFMTMLHWEEHPKRL